jgi:hypothetical protein
MDKKGCAALFQKHYSPTKSFVALYQIPGVLVAHG